MVAATKVSVKLLKGRFSIRPQNISVGLTALKLAMAVCAISKIPLVLNACQLATTPITTVKIELVRPITQKRRAMISSRCCADFTAKSTRCSSPVGIAISLKIATNFSRSVCANTL